MREDSPFLEVPTGEWVASNERAFAIRDRHPVTVGHTLVVTRRQIADWWGASDDERLAVLALVDEVKAALDQLDPRPDGYNVGFNAGEASGQTVPHLHIHVIPRYEGDVADPRGGVRHVIPGRGNYLVPRASALRDGPSRPLAPSLADAFDDERIDRFDLAVSFVMRSGLERLDAEMRAALGRSGARLRLLTTDYLGITERVALERLLVDLAQFPNSLEVRVFRAGTLSFHPKAYVFGSSEDPAVGYGFVGSANLSTGGLVTGVEWTLRTDVPSQVVDLRARFDELWADERSQPLTAELVEAYVEAPRVSRWIGADDAAEAVTPEAVATEIQVEALDALEQSRANGFGAGLVVLATGLGKTWLAGFDSNRPQFRRVLFLAHREEILRQALAVFRRVQPLRSAGLLVGDIDESSCEVVFASVQTFVNRMGAFQPDAFDYVVIDEFHHASASTYRRILGYLDPTFMLGLTATPDRTDGADLLALCDDNLVYEAPLAAGITRGALVPFEYLGIADTVDFEPIPWRNGKFDPAALENAVTTRDRAESALAEWRQSAGDRTLGFCVSVRHAEFMAEFFRDNGVLARAVHASAGSAPRHESLDALARGDLQVLFSVDLFNEGIDVPSVDTILMLRPTASPVLFLQQLGRGLRLAPGKTALAVIDFVGNHRSFLLKPRLLLGLTGHRFTDSQLAKALRDGHFDLPPGCRIDYRLEAVDILASLLRSASRGTALMVFIAQSTQESGQRPTAVQAYRAGLNPASANKDGGWFAVLDDAGLLTSSEEAVLRDHGGFLRAVAVEPMTKAYKMVVLRALTMAGALGEGMSLDLLSSLSQRLVARDPRLVEDARSVTMPDPASLDPASWAAYWRKWPIAAWLGELAGKDGRWFVLDGQRFDYAKPVAENARGELNRMVGELVDWRLARYLDTKQLTSSGAAIAKVSHNGRTPIIFLDRDHNPPLPTGRGVSVVAGGATYQADFVRIAINVARAEPQGSNVLPDLLWSWFGADAGAPGTHHRVMIERDEDGAWHLSPVGPVADGTAAMVAAR